MAGLAARLGDLAAGLVGIVVVDRFPRRSRLVQILWVQPGAHQVRDLVEFDVDPVPFTVLVNPVLEPLDDELEQGWEGCLSVPGMRGLVPRYKRLRYRGFDASGHVIDRTVEDFHARVVQHECDHLIGVLYPMRMRDFSQFGYTEVLFPGMDAGDDD